MDEAFSSNVADAVLARMAQGLARRNPKRVLSVFDAARYADYAAFAERVRAVLSQYDSFRTYYHVLEASEQDGRGAAQVDMTMERTSVNSGSVPDRRQARARFEFERGTKGWRIVAMTPPDLLTE
jgi:ferredoxin-NADP reductase